jgi:hypothetical protein
MTDDVSRVADKFSRRLATFIVREATERNQHPMDFAETFTDVLMATVMAKMVAQKAEEQHGC